MSFDKRTQMPVRAKMESKAYWVVDAADCVDVLSSLKPEPEANILSLDTTYAMIKGGGIQRDYVSRVLEVNCIRIRKAVT